MAGWVCIDASLALAWVIPDPLEQEALLARERWHAQRLEMVSPPLFRAEVTSVLRQKVFDSLLHPTEGEAAFLASLLWEIELIAPAGLQERAWAMAKLLAQRRAYDAQYLGVASLLDCELWTADRRLYNAARRALSWVHWAGEPPP